MADHPVMKRFGSTTLLYALAAIVILGSISLLFSIDSAQADTYYYWATALVFAAGILHAWLLHKLVMPVQPDEFWRGFLFTMLLMLGGTLTAAFLYYYLKLDFKFLTYIFPFLLPYVIWQVYQFYVAIPSSVFKVWYYPLNEPAPDLDMIDLSKIEVIQFLFTKNPTETTLTNFTSKAPLNMSLGQLFFIFINDYNDKNPHNPIVFLRSADEPFGWQFFRKSRWLVRRLYFDADLSFLQNAIQPGERIFAVRMND
jgi:hypothetical protein